MSPRWTWRLLMALNVWTVLCTAPAVAEEIRDWPCDLPLAERFVPAEVWDAALPTAAPGDWREDPGVREVVEFAANPENPPSQGAKKITAFAASLGAGREQRLLLVFAGLLEQFNLLRGFVIEGVRDFVVRAKILREAVAQNDAALAALPQMAAPKWRRGGGAIWKPGHGMYGAWTMPWRKPSSSAIATRISTGSCAS